MKSKFNILDGLTLILAILFGVVCCFGDYFHSFGKNGNNESIKWGVIVAAVLFVLSYGAKFLKTTTVNFQVCRILEYLFFSGFVVVLLVFGFGSFAAFVNVTSNKTTIQTELNNAIDNSLKMFDSYEAYVANRSNKSTDFMQSLIDNRVSDCASLQSHGFNGISCNNKNLLDSQKASNLMMLQEDLKVDKTQAVKILNEYKGDVANWNPFAIVDISKSLNDSIKVWINERTTKSEKINDFENQVFPFTATVNSFDLKNEFEAPKWNLLLDVLIVLVFGILMLLSYFLSKRDSRAEGLNFFGGYKAEEYEVIL
ncbi:MAG: hypothetical protein IKQ08_08535 [Paludibacteraceae bacterium]|nr:hypothetical protein [Paludibacteraceae bacterium]